MDTALCDTEVAGVFVEFHDDAGNTVGQAVFADWPGLRLPAVGDRLSCQARSTTSGRNESRIGRVADRYFEVQEDEAGRSCLWVRLEVSTVASERGDRRASQERTCSFSEN